MPQRTERSLTEVRARCMLILEDKEVVDLVKETSSPAAAFDVVFAITKDELKAKAARWLAVLRRDYSAVYRQLVE